MISTARQHVLTLCLCALLAACGGSGDALNTAPSVATTLDSNQAGGDRKRALALAPTKPGVAASAISNFEVAHVHPLDTTPDGKRLLSVNTANGTLEIFDISGTTVTLAAVVKVGLDPVTVRAASSNEAWVVNVLSDSVSIVDLTTNTVKATLETDDEPADVVFAGSPRRAYVSCAQARNLMIFDVDMPGKPLARIPVLGQQPRALATSPDGSKVYLAIFESGNGTTALSGKTNSFEPNIVGDRSGPYGGVNPPPNAANATAFDPPVNPANPAPSSELSMIVRRTANGDWLDDNGRSWRQFVSGASSRRAPGWDLIDRDIAIIDTASQAVTYQGGMLNIVMALAVNPVSGSIAVVGTDALNQVRYEPRLNGRFLRVQLGSFNPGQANAVRDLNPHLNYTTASVAVSERNKSLGDPRGIVWNAAGTRAYVIGMGSNNLVVLDAQGRRVGLRPPVEVGQGPTGIALQESQRRAFVLNRFDATVSIVNLDTESVSDVVRLSYDPTPEIVRKGRPMLFDTHRFSGLGHISCASCHVDGKTDRLAWDLGDPSGAMVSSTDATGRTVQHHPMKGPLLTQTLVDTMQSFLLHWRGDKPSLSHFAGAFQSLQGADAPGTAAEMADMKTYLETLRTPPNPYRNLDNSYPTALALPGPRGEVLRVGNAAAGRQEFESSCRSCHHGHTGRGNVFTDNRDFNGGVFLIPPRWQNFYRRDGLWFGDSTGSTAGFGYQQDGTFDSTHNGSRSDNMMAFMYSFNGSFPDTPAGLDANSIAVDAHAAVGKQAVISGMGVADERLGQLVALANSRAIGLVASACINGEQRGYAYGGNGAFEADRAGETATLAALTKAALTNGAITFTAVRSGTETRTGIDEDGDGVLNGAAGNTALRACTSKAGNSLLVNGSFEANPLAAGAWAHMPSLMGWQASSGSMEVWRNLNGWRAAAGQSWIELDAATALDVVSQTVATTAGQSLELRFSYSARPGVPAQSNRFNVLWNGVVIDTLAPEGVGLAAPAWQTTVYKVQATGRDTLAFAEAGTNDGLGTLIDAVDLYHIDDRVTTNLALGQIAKQSSVAFGGDASRAVDGNTNGVYWSANSVTHTDQQAQSWWQVDLGSNAFVDTVTLYNRTDCCASRLSNFHVLVSTTDMTGRSLSELLSDPGVRSEYVSGTAALSIHSFGITARYVRIQLAGTDYLSLAEVEVMGSR